jgi:hypothetical protein
MAADAQAELLEAIAAEGRGHRALLEGDGAAGREAMRAAAGHYRASWEAAPPSALGRLVGMLKATLIAGGGEAEAAAYARAELPGDAESPTASYVRAIAALVDGDDDEAAAAAARMPAGSPAFARTAAAIGALARRDGAAYAEALDAIVADFAARDAHLTGVPIADTALMLERLAAPRGLACRPQTPLLPPDGGADA